MNKENLEKNLKNNEDRLEKMKVKRDNLEIEIKRLETKIQNQKAALLVVPKEKKGKKPEEPTTKS